MLNYSGEVHFTYRTDVPHYLDTITDPLGNTSTQTLHDRGNVVREVDPTGLTRTVG